MNKEEFKNVFSSLKYIVILITYILSFYYWFNENTQYFATLLMVFMDAISFILVHNKIISKSDSLNKIDCVNDGYIKFIFKNCQFIYYMLFFLSHVILFISFVFYFMYHDNIVRENDLMNKNQKKTYEYFRYSVIATIVITWVWGVLLINPTIMHNILCHNSILNKMKKALLFILMMLSFILNIIVMTFSVFYKNGDMYGFAIF